MTEPYISVIISVYNRTQYVGEALNSVLSQTLDRDKYEVLVITNVDLPERDGVKIIKSNERWYGAMIAQGIEEARGEIISVLDDDDLFLPNKLEVIYKIFKENDKISLVKNPVKRVDMIGKERLDPLPKEPIMLQPKDLNLDTIWEAIAKYKLLFNNSSLSFRKEKMFSYLDYLKKVKLSFDTFTGLLFLFTSPIMIWNQYLGIYRVTMSSSSRNLINLNQYIERISFHMRVIYDDLITLSEALKKSEFEELLEKHINYHRIVVKLWSKNLDIKVSLKDAFNAIPLQNPRIPRWKVFLLYLAASSPYFLKKNVIYMRSYKKQLKAQNLL